MRWSNYFIPTMKEVPGDAEIPSHQLMLRAGLIRRLAGGLYTYLPAGLRALQQVQQIIREEMNRAGALECLMPALHPKEIWERTGRYETLAEVMFGMEDRQGRKLVLGPTHEEIITDLVARELTSYRQLPKNFYQIQTKFRDEIRPRFGLMRAKEFIMKDAYSFDADWEGVQRSYQAMYDAYDRIFRRCGLTARAVEADTGAMGGSASHEFMVVADAGEDAILDCESCGYAANLEKAERRPKDVPPDDDIPAVEEVDTPNVKTIDEVADFLKVAPEDCLKTMIYRHGDQFTAVLAPGDRAVNECKLVQHLEGTPVALAEEADVVRLTGAAQGFAGPVGLDLPLLADTSLKVRRGRVAGANRTDAHLRNVDLQRDAGDSIQWADVTEAAPGDACPRCENGELREIRGIEVGHVFQLGTKYSESLGASYLDANGQQHPMIMGCYGIGVSRTLQAVIEQHHDKDGIQWPASVAPFVVEVIPLNVKHEPSMQTAIELTQALEAEGISVLMDDRDERPGFKFKDADLLGLPLRVAIGERSLKQGKLELKVRTAREREDIPLENGAEEIIRRARELMEALASDHK